MAPSSLYFHDPDPNDENAHQLWTWVQPDGSEYGSLLQKVSSCVLDGTFTAENKGNLYLHKFVDNPHQRWKLLPVGSPGRFKLKQEKSGMVLDGDGNNLYFFDINDGPFQVWTFEPKGDGMWGRVIHVRSGKVLDGSLRAEESFFKSPLGILIGAIAGAATGLLTAGFGVGIIAGAAMGAASAAKYGTCGISGSYRFNTPTNDGNASLATTDGHAPFPVWQTHLPDNRQAFLGNPVNFMLA
jgi:hypothetical protein